MTKNSMNIESLLAIIYARAPLEVGMAEALQLLQLLLEGVHYLTGDDAWNIAAILADILLRARDSFVT